MIELGYDAYEARINPLGGALASLRYAGRDLVVPQHRAGDAHGFSGAVLAPWSNRIGDGRYVFGGDTHALPVNEPDRRNALHGLVLGSGWEHHDDGPGATRLLLRLAPVDGYPFRLELSLRYRLSESGLTVELDATNTGDAPAPYGCGFHPYLLPESGLVDDLTLELDAHTRLLIDSPRHLPAGRDRVAGGPYDFSTARPIGALRLDDAFTGAPADDSGAHRLRCGDVDVWWESSLRWVQLFTAPDRSALAVEPCTAPPDAFRSGDDLVSLRPGASHRVRWGVRVRAAGEAHAAVRQ